MILYPPAIQEITGPIVFLAGPIQGAPDWQAKAITYFQSHAPDLHLASPRKEYLEGTFNYAQQVDWESHYLKQAADHGVVLFYLAKEAIEVPGRAYAQTSRFELGEWTTKHQWWGSKLVIGIEEGFSNARYIKRRLSQDAPNISILANLADTCQAAIELVKAND